MKPKDFKLENLQQVLQDYTLPFFMMLASSIAVLTPILAAKIIIIGSIKFSGNLVAIMIVYGIVDIINELWGKKHAQATAIMLVIIRFTIYLTLIPFLNYLPAAIAPVGYAKLMSFTLRSLFAAEIAVIISTLLVDIPVFSKLKEVTVLPFFARTTASNLLAAFFASGIFIFITYWGSGQNLYSLTIGQFTARIVMLLMVAVASSITVALLKGKIKQT